MSIVIPQEVQVHLDKVEQIHSDPGLSMPIDEKMRLLVAALWAHGVTTTASCEGHLNKDTDGPYIEIESQTAAAFERKMKSAGYGSTEHKRYVTELENENLHIRDKLLLLLKEFYQNRKTPYDTWIITEYKAKNRCRLKCQGNEIMQLPQYIHEKPAYLKVAQDEMQAFAEFLCAKIGGI